MSAKIVVEVANDNEYDERNPTYLDAKQVGEAALAMADICYILQLKEENILEAFSDKVIEKIEEFDVVTSMDYFKDVD